MTDRPKTETELAKAARDFVLARRARFVALAVAGASIACSKNDAPRAAHDVDASAASAAASTTQDARATPAASAVASGAAPDHADSGAMKALSCLSMPSEITPAGEAMLAAALADGGLLFAPTVDAGAAPRRKP